MSRCSRCGRLNEPEALYCQDCGAPITIEGGATEEIDTVRCSVCGKNNPVNTRFCHVCGVRLRESIPPSSGAKPVIDCPYCNRVTPAGFAFCQYCGEQIDAGPPSEEAGLPPTPPAGVPALQDSAGSEPWKEDTVVSRAAFDDTTDIRPNETAEMTGLNLSGARPPARAVSSGFAPSEQGMIPRPDPARVASGVIPVEPSPSPVSREQAKADAEPKTPFLVLLDQRGEQMEKRRLLLSFPYDLGRTDGQWTLSRDRYLNDRHARFIMEDQDVWVCDLDTLNGIYLRINTAEPLLHGSTLLLGRQVLRVELLTPDEALYENMMENGIAMLGTPCETAWARLRQITQAGVGRDIYHLYGEKIVVARTKGRIIFPDDEGLSDPHAVLSLGPDGGMVEDLGSITGTYIRVRGRRKLTPGDVLRMGEQRIRFDLVET